MRHLPSAESPELRANNREQIAAGRKQQAQPKADSPLAEAGRRQLAAGRRQSKVESKNKITS